MSPFRMGSGNVVNPQLLRAILLILTVRAIFISPSLGSEYGRSRLPGDAALRRLDEIRPAQLRYTRPISPSAAPERGDCLDGGDDDEPTSLAEALADGRFCLLSTHRSPTHRPASPSMPRPILRLRC